jgi:hypothetical protein
MKPATVNNSVFFTLLFNYIAKINQSLKPPPSNFGAPPLHFV